MTRHSVLILWRLRLREARTVVQYAATMRRALVSFVLALALAACGTDTGTFDAALDGYAGCITPQSCYTLACACNRYVPTDDHNCSGTGGSDDKADPCEVCPVTMGSTINACPSGSTC